MTKHGTKCKMSMKCRWHILDVCPICFEEVQFKELYKTSCNHTFHTGCLIKWYETSDDCPICRHTEDDDPLIIFKRNVKTEMEKIYMEAIHSLESDVQRLRRRRVRRDN